MLGNTLHQPKCAICVEPIARLEPTKRDSAWTHGTDNGRTPRVTAKDKKLNAEHTARP